ncbi:MAG: Com family DNA-binding transcriptional regulator [Magnetococcales bacterium]|nr:Com family DNA-binding transcriptional regulator [Magnetococcales bacterium]MBF0583070.1 Com family DNA-binding transcriptional regulator [Magnetococcales bacterium]
MLKEMYCGHCGRLLAKQAGSSCLEIKCQRCKTLNNFNSQELAQTDRRRATLRGIQDGKAPGKTSVIGVGGR